MRTHEAARGGIESRGRSYAGGRRGGGFRRGRDFRPKQARRRDAGLGRRQAETTGEDPAGDGGAGGRRQAGGGGRASHRGRKGTAAPSRRPQEAGQTGGAAISPT